MEKIEILWLQSGAAVGGTEMMNFRTWQQLDRSRFAVQLCFLDGEGVMSHFYRQMGHEPIHFNFQEQSVGAVMGGLRRLLRSRPVHIVHIFGLRANLLARPVAHFSSSAKIITGQRSVDLWRRPWHNWADRLTGRWVDLYLANCQAVNQWLQQVVKVPAGKTLTLHSGLDPTPFMAARPGQIRPLLGITTQEKVIVCVANLRPVKNHPLLLQALHQLHQRQLPCHLLLVGEGPQHPHLEQLTRQLGLTAYVHFLGYRADIPALLADSDVAVLASHWEGLPGSVMEAMAAGRPIVATAVGGLPELVLDGVNGFLVPPNDPATFTHRLAQLLVDETLGAKMGVSGREYMLQNFRIATKVQKLEQIYNAFSETFETTPIA